MNGRVFSSNRLAVGCAMLMVPLMAASKSGGGDQALAESLAQESTRQAAIASLAASGRTKVPLLLSWIKKSPRHIDGCAFLDGLMEALGELKVKEAVPFLVQNISFRRGCAFSGSPWIRSPEFIERNFPAVGALVKIGPEASRAVMAAFDRMADETDWRAAVFVVSEVSGVPEAPAFLESALERANRDRYWAEDAIKRLNSVPSPAR